MLNLFGRPAGDYFLSKDVLRYFLLDGRNGYFIKFFLFRET